MSKKQSIFIFCISIAWSISAIYKFFQKDSFISPKTQVYKSKENDVCFLPDMNVIYDLHQSLPSSTETCFVIKDLENTYHQDLLIQELSLSCDTTNFKTALYLGMFHADMNYLTAFEKQALIPYFEFVKQLERKLENLGESLLYFENKMPISVITDFDSLLIQNTLDIESIKEQLWAIKKGNLNILVSTGGFIESLYLACKTFEKNPRPELKNWIGLQSHTLDQYLILLSFYSMSEEFPKIKKLEDELRILKEIYTNEVRFEYSHQEKTSSLSLENEIVIQSDAYTLENVLITDKTLKKIVKVIAKVRNKILK